MDHPDKARAKQIILEIVHRAGGSLAGTAKLQMAFYVAHLFYFEDSPGLLSDWPMVKLASGPGIDQGGALLQEIVAGGCLATHQVAIGPFPATRYTRTDRPCPGVPLNEDEVVAIVKAVQFVMPKTFAELTELTHEFSRSWNLAGPGDTLNIYIDVISEEEYARREQELATLRREMGEMEHGRFLEGALADEEPAPREPLTPRLLAATWLQSAG